MADVEIELSRIILIDWTEKTTELLYNEVRQFKDPSENNPFNVLFECAKTVLILPHSNADVNGIFSAMNYVASKVQIKLKLPLLKAI